MDAVTLALLALALGMRHGLDADHLVAIDSLTRHNAEARPRLAAASGALFALGHGSVVLAVAALGVWLGRSWSPPAFLEAAGAWISITLLLSLGIVNLRAGWARRGVGGAALVGLRARLFARVLRARHPFAVAGVGAAFAVAFDTVSQALLLVAAASAIGGAPLAAVVATMFVVGMLLVDGASGWWIARLLQRGSAAVAAVSQRLALFVGAMGIAMAGLGIARLHLEPANLWGHAHDVALSAALVVLLPLAIVAASRWPRPAGTVMQTAPRKGRP